MVDSLDDSIIMEEREKLMVSLVDDEPLHQEIWKKAGIFEAILAPMFEIYKHYDLILALAERWCMETNTFIFPWGEATITLEDMVVLGSFSVLGHCVLEPVKTDDCVKVEKNLHKAHKGIKARKLHIGHHAWMEHFARRGDHLEHVAFLTLWLSTVMHQHFHNNSPYIVPHSSHKIFWNRSNFLDSFLQHIKEKVSRKEVGQSNPVGFL
ncbi:serine/threonine-protein phosphatase 7 long form homolog [Capsicum annuum]|uniref:serine/threonine-protein phosphatase 7 long form homolog n=1 Tax=Capsicum annuum TaxID=4072 RepID=UPI001FB05B71|nr:serine/threonine-protein phosphatase 7 long form homolog [Capsicum annuum]